MSLILSLSTLALRQVVDSACSAVGVKEGGEAAVKVAAFLYERFTDQSQRPHGSAPKCQPTGLEGAGTLLGRRFLVGTLQGNRSERRGG